MKATELGDLVTVRGGGTPQKSVAHYYGGGIPWVTPKDMKSRVIGGSLVTLSQAGVASSPAKLIPAHSVLVVVRSGVLKHTLPVGLTSVPVTVNQDMKALTPGPRLDAAYLAHLLEARSAEVLSWVRATTADNFPVQKLLQLQIDLPPIEEQRRIAAILDRAFDLLATNAEVTNRVLAMEQSLFSRSTGAGTGLTLREDGWDFLAGKNIVAGSAGEHPRNKVIKVSAVSSGVFNPSESKPLPVNYGPPAAHEIHQGDILFGRASGSLHLLGATARVGDVPDHLYLPDKVWRLELGASSTLPRYALALLRSKGFRDYVQQNASGAAGVRNIGKSTVLDFIACIAGMRTQERFVDSMSKVDRLAESVGVRRTLLEEALRTTRTRAFSGRL